MIAGELKRLADTVRYDWVGDVVKPFLEFRDVLYHTFLLFGEH
jgi:hypothetical protein